jgi:CelD/BcsL family acetyltransferase involved in cellulose biosynthesis
MLDLRNCQAGSALRAAQLAELYTAAASNCGWHIKVAASHECRILELPPTLDEYLGGLSSNSRQNFRRKLRKLAQAGVTIESVDTLDEQARADAMEAMYALHQQRWTERGEGGGFPEGPLRAMHRHVAANMATRGWLDLRVARSAEGRILGAIYNFVYNGTAYYYQLGFDTGEAWSSYSLGFCLLADSIEAAIKKGCHSFDLMRGDHEYKKHFGGLVARNVRISVYRYNWLPLVEDASWRVRRILQRRNLQPANTGQVSR